MKWIGKFYSSPKKVDLWGRCKVHKFCLGRWFNRTEEVLQKLLWKFSRRTRRSLQVTIFYHNSKKTEPFYKSQFFRTQMKRHRLFEVLIIFIFTATKNDQHMFYFFIQRPHFLAYTKNADLIISCFWSVFEKWIFKFYYTISIIIRRSANVEKVKFCFLIFVCELLIQNRREQ